MKSSLLITLFLLCAPPARLAPQTQSPPAPAEHFENDGLSFDYPAGWTVEDKSDARTQRLVVRSQGGGAFVEVSAPRVANGSAAERKAAEESLWASTLEDAARLLGGAKVPSKHDQCPPFGERPGAGAKFGGKLEGQSAMGEVYEMYADGRYVNVSFLRAEREEKTAAAAWKTFLETLKAEGGDPRQMRMVMGHVTEGKAVSKPQPAYPPEAKAAGAEGAVAVRIIVGERGDVIEAHATSGDPRLYAASEAAAMLAKYTPTSICGRPVKVSGVITYTFVR